MKFEINPNELTTEQRNHVSDFIRNWPQLGSFDDLHIPRNAHSIKEDAHGVRATIPIEESNVTAAVDPNVAALKFNPGTGRLDAISNEEFYILDAEQKADLREFSGPDEAQALGTVAADNLNAIFGTPDIAKDMSALIEDRKSLVSDIMNSVRLDKEGLPWDSRIHSSSKAVIADGTWKLRRGVDPAEVATVKAQLRELMAVPQVGPVSVPVPPAPKSHYLIDQQPTVTLTDLISRISKAIAENRITQATVTEVCLKHQVSEFALLSNRPDLLPLIDADMKALGV